MPASETLVPRDVAALEVRAGEAAALLKALSNEHRLMILCRLMAAGELCVGALVEAVGLSQSALSQHLARLREEGLVAYRRESQTLFYRVADARAARVVGLLLQLYCPDLPRGGSLSIQKEGPTG